MPLVRNIPETEHLAVTETYGYPAPAHPLERGSVSNTPGFSLVFCIQQLKNIYPMMLTKNHPHCMYPKGILQCHIAENKPTNRDLKEKNEEAGLPWLPSD